MLQNFKRFSVEERAGIGHVLVAGEDIEELEAIFAERPAVAGPNHDTEPVCLCCNRLLTPAETTERRCPNCSWPQCDDCFGSGNPGLHSDDECAVLRKCHAGANVFPYSAVVPLRMALGAINDTAEFRDLDRLMDHDEERRRNGKEWKMFQEEVRCFVVGMGIGAAIYYCCANFAFSF